MKNDRFEIQVRTLQNGTLFADIWDSYWDGKMSAFFDPSTGTFRPACYETTPEKYIQEITAGLSNPQPGWYAVELETYPFGKPARTYPIPGRHLRYRTR